MRQPQLQAGPKSDRRAVNLSLRLCVAGFFLLGSWFALKAAPKQTTHNPFAGANDTGQSVEPITPGTKKIEEIRVGDRVPAKNPTGEFDDSLGEFEAATWRRLSLKATKVNGGRVDAVLLRPLWWLNACGATVGGTIDLRMHELGVEGAAELLSIQACPPLAEGTGPVVTGTFKHQSAHIVDIHVEGLDGPIGVTTVHPFWSEDRQEFVAAGDLRAGERLRALTGTPRVTSISPRGPPQPVYNLEVHGEHVYRVSKTGLLVHNNCWVEFLKTNKGKYKGKDWIQKARLDYYSAKSKIGQLKHKPTSGARITLNPDKTTTLIGAFEPDLQHILKQLDYPVQSGKSLRNVSYAGNQGGFNLLNVSDELYQVAQRGKAKGKGGFFTQVNAKWVDAVAARGDDIIVVSDLKHMWARKGSKRTLTGFGKEIERLKKTHGYVYDETTRRMLPGKK